MTLTGPLKRHPALISYSKDHHFGLLFVWKIRQGLNKHKETERIRLYALHFFENNLRTHFQEEETNILQELPSNDPMRLRVEKDHANIRALIEDLKSGQNGSSELVQLATILDAHIRFEERELFQYLQQTLPPAGLQRLQKSDETLLHDDNWEDEFWL